MTVSAVRSAPALTAPITASRRLVVKIGSALLVEEATGSLHQAWLDSVIGLLWTPPLSDEAISRESMYGDRG